MSASGIQDAGDLHFELLPESLQELLAEALDNYVIAVEEGRKPDRQSFLEQYPAIQPQLSAYLDQVDWLSSESQGTVAGTDPVVRAWGLSIDSCGLSYDDFQIESEIGRGAMGIVYRAFQKSLQRWVAVKVLPFGTMLDDSRTERFWREAKTAGALEHPGIVSVYGLGRQDSICFYAMALVEGQSLDVHIRDAEARLRAATEAGRQASPGQLQADNPLLGQQRSERIANFVAQAADAIAAANEAGVVHRDIKPSNLILDAQGRIKVTDFGLAMNVAELELTRSGEVVGTIRYMSPEQAAGKRSLVDQRSDVYCLGATLYELLTLTAPFDSDCLVEVIKQKEAGLVKPLRSIDPSIPRPLQTIALKAMRPEAVDRYQSVAVLASDLRAYLDGRPIAAVDLTLVEVIGCWARRHTGVVLTGLLALALLFVVAVIFNVTQSTQRHALQLALQDREKLLQSARRAVDQLGVQFAEKLALIPEAAELRRDLLRSSLDYYADFLADAQHDTALGQAVAEAKWKVAQATAGLESMNKATEIYEDTDRQLASLAQEMPELSSLRAEMLSDWAMRYMGRFQGEASAPELALSVLDRMSSDQPDLPSASRALLKNNRAFVLASMQRTAEAMKSAQEAIELLKQVGDSTPRDTGVRSLCVSMLNLCQILDQAGQTQAALEVAQECDACTRRFTGSSATDQSNWKQLQAKTLATLASLRWKHQGASAALSDLQAVVDLRTRQLESRPDSIGFRWDLAIALNNLGMALAAIEPAERDAQSSARLAFERAYAIAKAETESDPQSATAAQRAANIQNNLGLLLRQMGLKAEASNTLQRAADHIDRAAALDKDNINITSSRDRIRHNLLGD